jgi:hypothetical protein
VFSRSDQKVIGAKLSSFVDCARACKFLFVGALFDENLTHVQRKIFSSSDLPFLRSKKFRVLIERESNRAHREKRRTSFSAFFHRVSRSVSFISAAGII